MTIDLVEWRGETTLALEHPAAARGDKGEGRGKRLRQLMAIK